MKGEGQGVDGFLRRYRDITRGYEPVMEVDFRRRPGASVPSEGPAGDFPFPRLLRLKEDILRARHLAQSTGKTRDITLAYDSLLRTIAVVLQTWTARRSRRTGTQSG